MSSLFKEEDDVKKKALLLGIVLLFIISFFLLINASFTKTSEQSTSDPNSSIATSNLLLDPNPKLIDKQGNLIQNVTLASNLIPIQNGKIVDGRNGTIADGVSKLIIKLVYNNPLRFSIEGKSPNDLRGGTLAPLLNKSGTSNSLSSTNVVYPNLTKTNESLIVAVYTPPDFINEPNASYKPVTLLINNPKNPSAAPSPVSQITIRLYHPPVILVHGLWENPSLWNILSNFLQTLNQSKLNSTLADYRIHNATTFDPYFNKTFGNYGINATRNAIGRALEDYHGNATAASQVDVVAHSMGGLIARGFVQQPDYKNPSNFMKGYIHRLITIGTPHYGGQLALFCITIETIGIAMFQLQMP